MDFQLTSFVWFRIYWVVIVTLGPKDSRETVLFLESQRMRPLLCRSQVSQSGALESILGVPTITGAQVSHFSLVLKSERNFHHRRSSRLRSTQICRIWLESIESWTPCEFNDQYTGLFNMLSWFSWGKLLFWHSQSWKFLFLF